MLIEISVVHAQPHGVVSLLEGHHRGAVDGAPYEAFLEAVIKLFGKSYELACELAGAELVARVRGGVGSRVYVDRMFECTGAWKLFWEVRWEHVGELVDDRRLYGRNLRLDTASMQNQLWRLLERTLEKGT